MHRLISSYSSSFLLQIIVSCLANNIRRKNFMSTCQGIPIVVFQNHHKVQNAFRTFSCRILAWGRKLGTPVFNILHRYVASIYRQCLLGVTPVYNSSITGLSELRAAPVTRVVVTKQRTSGLKRTVAQVSFRVRPLNVAVHTGRTHLSHPHVYDPLFPLAPVLVAFVRHNIYIYFLSRGSNPSILLSRAFPYALPLSNFATFCFVFDRIWRRCLQENGTVAYARS